MKKKILSIIACFMLCCMSVFMFAGCSNEPNKHAITETEAQNVMATAMEAIEEESVISISGGMYGIVDMELIATETMLYSKVEMDMFASVLESWTIQEGSDWVEYTKSIVNIAFDEGEEPTEMITYTREVLTDFTSPKDSLFEESDFDQSDFEDETLEFVEAYIKGDKTEIVFSIEDEFGAEGKYTLTFENGKLTNIKASSGLNSLKYEFKYGSEILNSIPSIPQPEEGWEDVESVPEFPESEY